MDSFFDELFQIVKRQVDTNKMDGLLPKVYHEFDVLVQYENNDELNEIYHYVARENPIQTNDSLYNDIFYTQLKKEILKRLFQLNDFTSLNEEIDPIMLEGSEDDIERYLQSWEDSILIYNYLRERTLEPVQKKTKPLPKASDSISEEPIKKDTSKLVPQKEIVKPKKTPKTVEKEPEVWPTYVAPRESAPPRETAKVVKPAPAVRTPAAESPDKFQVLEFVNQFLERYDIVVNREALRKLGNPKPTFFRIVTDYVDLQQRTPYFYIELFLFLEQASYPDLIEHIIARSIRFRKLASVHIGLLQEPEMDSKLKLLDLLKDNETDYIQQSQKEVKLRLFMDGFKQDMETVYTIKKNATAAAIKAPLTVHADFVSGPIHYCKHNILSRGDSIIDESNIAHLYWSMILCACLGIYVTREKVYDFIDAMDCISHSAVLLIQQISNNPIKIIIQDLAKYYIREIYQAATLTNDYDNWWARQKEDLLNSKLNGISKLSEYSSHQ